MGNKESDSDLDASAAGHNLVEAGREELMVGALGFNFQYFRSIWTLFRNPFPYFQAAKTSNWMNKYTPSLPLLMGIVALTMALQFFWGKPSGTYMRSVAAQFDTKDGVILQNDPQFMAVISDLINTTNLIGTPIYIAFIFLLALIYKAWGMKLPLVVRVRYLFAVVIPGSIVGVISTIFSPLLSEGFYSAISFPIYILVFAVTFLTAMRGPYHKLKTKDAILRSSLLTLCVIVVTLASQIISFIGASIVHIDKIGPYVT